MKADHLKKIKKENVISLHSELEKELQKINQLIIISDSIPVYQSEEGYISTKRKAVKVNGIYYDIGFCFSKEPLMEKPDYNIPWITIGSKSKSELYTKVAEEFLKNPVPRYLVNIDFSEYPILFDRNYYIERDDLVEEKEKKAISSSLYEILELDRLKRYSGNDIFVKELEFFILNTMQQRRELDEA